MPLSLFTALTAHSIHSLYTLSLTFDKHNFLDQPRAGYSLWLGAGGDWPRARYSVPTTSKAERVVAWCATHEEGRVHLSGVKSHQPMPSTGKDVWRALYTSLGHIAVCFSREEEGDDASRA